jgi:Sec-independent protein translocase protein TatA
MLLALSFNPVSLFVVGVVGLLLFVKDLPLIIRHMAKEYCRHKKLIRDAQAEIHREMELAEQRLKEEKRLLHRDPSEFKFAVQGNDARNETFALVGFLDLWLSDPRAYWVLIVAFVAFKCLWNWLS